MSITPTQPSPDWNMVELRWAGTYLDGRPAAGKIVVTYSSSAPLLDDGTPPILIFPVRLEVPLTTTDVVIDGVTRSVGYASLRVPASNDPDIQGSGGTYAFTEALLEGSGRSGVNFVADKDAPGGVIWLDKVITGSVPTTPATPLSVVYWSDFNALKAKVDAAPVFVTLPTGAAVPDGTPAGAIIIRY